MSTKEFTDFMNSLKGSTSTLHPDFDLTWGIPNSLSISNQMLIFLMAKTSIIPFIEDYTTVSSQLGLKSEQAASIQEINSDLLLLQRMLIQNCMQQYLLGSLVKSKIDEIISSFPEIKDIKSIEDFIAYIENFKEAKMAGGQKGGCCGQLTSIIMFLFLLMVLSTPSSAGWFDSSTPTLTPPPQEEPTKAVAVFQGRPGAIVSIDPNSGLSVFNSEVATLGVAEFSKNVRELIPQKGMEHDLSGAIRVWSPEETNKIKKLYTELMVFAGMDKAGPENGSQALDRLLRDINEQLRVFSNSAEGQCINLMEMSDRNGAFKDLQDYGNASEIIDQINSAKIQLERQQTEEYKTAVKTGATDALQYASVGFAVGSAVPGIGNVAGAGIGFASGVAANYWDYMNNAEVTANKFESAKGIALRESNPYNQLTIQERTHYKEQAFAFSKVYCSFGFKLKLKRTNDSIQVIGSNVNNENIITLIETLKSNIDLSITSLVSKQGNDDTLVILDSLHQRLEVLSAISRKVGEVVQFAADAKMIQLDDGPDTIPQIKNIFDEQILALNELLSQVKQDRPLSLQKKQASLNIKKAKLEEDKIDRDIVILDTENLVLNNAVSKNATMSTVKGWTEIGFAPFVGLASGASTAFGDAAMEILKGVFGNFPTWALVGGGITILALAGCALSGQAFMFRDAAGAIWWVIASPFKGIWWVCKRIFSPIYGWIYRPVGIVVQQGPPAVGPGQGPQGVVPEQGPQGVVQGPPVVVPGPQDLGQAAQAVGQAADGAVVLVGPAPNMNDIDGGRKTRKMRKLKRKISKNKTKKRISKSKTKKRISKVRRRLTKHRK